MMNKQDKQKSSYDCDNNVHETSRHERKSVENPSNDDAFNAKESKLEKLPSNCFQHILSFMTFVKVAQMKQVSKIFNKAATMALGTGQRKLERRLEQEIEKSEKRRLFLTNRSLSYDMQRFLIILRDAINYCLLTYSLVADYSVPGKLLDEANYLMNDYNSSTTVPYFHEHVCNQKSHTLLSLIAAHSERACGYFFGKILPRFTSFDEVFEKRSNQTQLEVDSLFEQNKMREMQASLLKNQRKKFDCGKQTSRELFQLLSKLNENVANLIQQSIKANEEVETLERVINQMDMPIVKTNEVQSNCLFGLSVPFNSPLVPTKRIGIYNSKLPNLATLPSSCIRNIVLYLNCDKVAQLRLICESFNKVCKEALNQEFEELNQKLEFKITFKEQDDKRYVMRMFDSKTNMMKDVCSLLKLCQNNYKFYLGTNYFITGKVLDEAKLIYNAAYPLDYDDFDDDYGDIDRYYKCRPHYFLFGLMDLVCKAVAHLKFTIVPKYFPTAQNHIFVPNFLNTSDVINFEEELHQLKLENKMQIYRNRKFLKIISDLKKKIAVLNKTLSEKIYVLKELK